MAIENRKAIGYVSGIPLEDDQVNYIRETLGRDKRTYFGEDLFVSNSASDGFAAAGLVQALIDHARVRGFREFVTYVPQDGPLVELYRAFNMREEIFERDILFRMGLQY